MKFTHLFIAGLSAAALLFQACTTSASDEEILSPYMDEDSFNRLPKAQQELLFTNFFLQAMYVNAETEVKDVNKYLDEGAKNGFTEDDYEFPDVSYMYSTLSDNFTNYFSPYIAERILKQLVYSEATAGIGADFQEIIETNCTTDGLCTNSGTLVFKHVYKNGPADKAGVLKGDTLLMIDGREPRNEQHFRRLEAVFDAGETIPFAIKRGEDTLNISITFDQYFSPTVFVDMVDSIPVITVSEFTDTTVLVTGTYGEFLDALEETAGAKSTIIDLRGNPGGTVEHCVNMAAEMLPKNDTIITIISHTIDSLTEEPYIDTTTFITEEDGIGAERYYVILADSNSASCAELMVAGVVSNTKSPVVGQTTYGKAIGQSYLPTIAGGLTGITSMRLLDKNWGTYQKYGIVPDFEEGDADKAMQKAVELAKEGTAQRTQGYGTVDKGHFTLAKKRDNKELDRGLFRIIRR
ncbi:C-terminal peptidase (prc) [Fibrobacter sp. UWT3]|uniref:S41 family peptidase n=1 Tax=Fibrobacter sp. UWT3 TaxID=1896225 RepID=UPI000BDD9F15|nr:S41 family peptidase [Fibrobacter sp. UWT3]SOE47378.1 C-terminal peptidase (prc) [Fibrobacter sp. UWT3]